VTQRVPSVRVEVAEGGPVRTTSRPDTLAVEEPLEIRVGGTSVSVTMRTPGDDFDLALGYLLTEGVLAKAADVRQLMHCLDEDESGSPTYNVVDVTLSPDAPLDLGRSARSGYTSSACGVCGKTSIESITTTSPYAVADDAVVLSPEVMGALPERLRERQGVFDRTGGLHAAGLFTPAGEPRVVREDVGRHNAVDKVTGARVVAGQSPSGAALVVSGRAGFELVQKAVAAGSGALVAVGAPTSLAVELAREAGLALYGFTSGKRTVRYA
jgi:FdhD protein